MSILRFPDEDKLSIEVEASLGAEFDFARRLYGFWVRHQKDEWLAKSRLPGHTLDLAMLLNVQLYRQFRSVYDECCRCEAFCASIVSRSIFETIVALLFALKPRVHIVVAPVIKNGVHAHTAGGIPKWLAKPPSKKNPRSKQTFLSRATRANLYFAHVAFADDLFAEKCQRTNGLKRVGALVAKNVSPSTVAHFENLVGPQWTYILRESHGYSGLPLASLARLLDKNLARRYETIYHFQSRMVHANDALRHAKDNQHGQIEPQCLSSLDEITGTLQSSVSMLLCGMIMMHGYIGFGPAMDHALDGFKKEFAELYSGSSHCNEGSSR